MEIIDMNVPIDGWFTQMNNYANRTINSASAVANALIKGNHKIIPTGASFLPVDAAVPVNTPTRPEIPIFPTIHRNQPSSPELEDIKVSLDPAPKYNIVEPTINLPTVPSPLEAILPVKDFVVNTSFDYPVPPDYAIPDVPSLLALDLPSPESIAIPIFDLTFPTSNSLVVPGISFSFSEQLYDSTLLTQIKNELYQRVQGGTGLSPVIEEAIWNRGRDREQRASLQAERTLLEERSLIGFSRPTGSQLSALAQIVQETQGKIIELSREIMIKQAELEQENVKTSIQQAIALEDSLIKESLAINQRSFEVAKYMQDLVIEIFKVEVTRYNSEVEAYKAFANAYQSRVQAELSKIEIFKSQIEAEKLKGDINEQNIRLYLAKIDAVKNNVEIYKSLVSTISEKLKVESLKIESYKSEIEAYSETVKSKALEYTMYSEQIKGELSKTQILESQVKAFTSRIQAYAAQAGIATKEAEIKSDLQELKIKKYEAELDAFIKQVQADQLLYQAAVDIYKGEAEMYKGDISLSNSVADIAIKQAENIIIQNKHASDIGVENARISLAAIQGEYNSIIEARKAAGSIYSQIASSALSAINVSASADVSFNNSRSSTEDVSV